MYVSLLSPESRRVPNRLKLTVPSFPPPSSSSSLPLQLIRNLQSSNLIKSPRVAAAMNSVDRAHYVPRKDEAYQDSPASIGFGATISAPHMFVSALSRLEEEIIKA